METKERTLGKHLAAYRRQISACAQEHCLPVPCPVETETRWTWRGTASLRRHFGVLGHYSDTTWTLIVIYCAAAVMMVECHEHTPYSRYIPCPCKMCESSTANEVFSTPYPVLCGPHLYKALRNDGGVWCLIARYGDGLATSGHLKRGISLGPRPALAFGGSVSH